VKCAPLNCGLYKCSTAQYKGKGKKCFNSCFEYENVKREREREREKHLLLRKYNMGPQNPNDFKLLKRQTAEYCCYQSGIQSTECENPTEPKLQQLQCAI
jgi:hypothetical protein